jgi:hypothetical protein
MDSLISNAIGRKRREGKVRPLQGNSPHDRPVSRVTRHLLPAPVKILRCFRMRFLSHGGIFLVRWGFQTKTKPWDGIKPPPAGRSRTQVKERAGRITLLLIVRR